MSTNGSPHKWAELAQAFIRGFDVKASARAVQRDNGHAIKPTWRDHAFTAAYLQRQTFAEIQYIVPGLIPEGLSMLVGRPKIGKSWMALDIGTAIALPGGTCLGGIEPHTAACSTAHWRTTRGACRSA